MRITGGPIRAARKFLRWTIADLAGNARVSIPTIQAIERTDGELVVGEGGIKSARRYHATASRNSLNKVAKALIKAAITPVPDVAKAPGLEARGDSVEPVSAWLALALISHNWICSKA